MAGRSSQFLIAQSFFEIVKKSWNFALELLFPKFCLRCERDCPKSCPAVLSKENQSVTSVKRLVGSSC